MSVVLTTHRDPHGRFGLTLPTDWEATSNQTAGVVFAAAERGPEPTLRPNLVVTMDLVSVDFKEWQLTNDRLLAEVLDQYQLIDLELCEVDGVECVRRLGHHTVGGSGAATMEQWCLLADGLGYTLTFTVPTLRYAAMCGGVLAIAESFRLRGALGEDES